MKTQGWIFLSLMLVWLIPIQANAQLEVSGSDYVILLPININSANSLILQRALVGIGPAKAQKIIEYRQNNGSFATIHELVHVKGIGMGTIRKNIDRISTR